MAKCCDDCLRCQILAAGANETALAMLEDHHEKSVAAGGLGLNWQAILAMLLQYGPQILSWILSLLHPPTPPAPPATKA